MTIRVVTPSTEFGPQLPPEGGTFYAHEAADGSRPFYKSSWPPLLQATALWLGRTDDDDGDGDDADDDVHQADAVFCNHFFLLLGTVRLVDRATPRGLMRFRWRRHRAGGAVRRQVDRTGIVDDGLPAVARVAAAPAPLARPPRRPADPLRRSRQRPAPRRPHPTRRRHPGQSLRLQCHSFTPTLFCFGTETFRWQRRALAVLSALVAAARRRLGAAPPTTTSATSAAGEGGATGELLPGSSLVFAALEVCLCLLVKFYPAIDPAAGQHHLSRFDNVSMDGVGRRIRLQK